MTGLSATSTPAEQEHVFAVSANPKNPKSQQKEILQNGGIKASSGSETDEKTPAPEQYAVPTPAQESPSRPLYLNENTEVSNHKISTKEEKSETVYHPDNQNENWENEYIQSEANLLDEPVLFSNSTKKHIDIGGYRKDHPTPLELVRKTIKDPDIIHENIKSDGKKAYFLVKENATHPTTKKPMRVIVKTTAGPHKHVVSTAYGTSKKPKGKVLWQKTTK